MNLNDKVEFVCTCGTSMVGQSVPGGFNLTCRSCGTHVVVMFDESGKVDPSKTRDSRDEEEDIFAIGCIGFVVLVITSLIWRIVS